MSDNVYFYILILCGIWSQGMIGTVADEIEESSDILVRQKRVVSYLPGEDESALITDAPYIVIIRYKNRIHCVGSILSHHVVITIPQCVQSALTEYQVVSRTSRTDRGSIHNVIGIKKHFGGHPSRPADGLALLTVDPPFEFGAYTFYIKLHSGPLLQGTPGLIAGWGFNSFSVNSGTCIRKHLRLIVVPIMAHRDCVNIYRPHFEINDKDICTYHPQRHCGITDGGAPLVVDGYLAGVHLWTQPYRDDNHPQYPDVFVVLQHSEYNQWIRTNMRNIEAQFQNHHN